MALCLFSIMDILQIFLFWMRIMQRRPRTKSAYLISYVPLWQDRNKQLFFLTSEMPSHHAVLLITHRCEFHVPHQIQFHPPLPVQSPEATSSPQIESPHELCLTPQTFTVPPSPTAPCTFSPAHLDEVMEGLESTLTLTKGQGGSIKMKETNKNQTEMSKEY